MLSSRLFPQCDNKWNKCSKQEVSRAKPMKSGVNKKQECGLFKFWRIILMDYADTNYWGNFKNETAVKNGAPRLKSSMESLTSFWRHVKICCAQISNNETFWWRQGTELTKCYETDTDFMSLIQTHSVAATSWINLKLSVKHFWIRAAMYYIYTLFLNSNMCLFVGIVVFVHVTNTSKGFNEIPFR